MTCQKSPWLRFQGARLAKKVHGYVLRGTGLAKKVHGYVLRGHARSKKVHGYVSRGHRTVKMASANEIAGPPN